jgi:predicted transcriptional regulator
MKSLLIQLDDPTYKALNQIAPARKRVRSEFIRQAIRQAVRNAEYAAMKQAYLAQPDSEAEADDWSTAEEFKL